MPAVDVGNRDGQPWEVMPDESEPLDAIHVRNWPRTETGPGCYVLLRPFEDGDPEHFRGDKTCLCVRSSPHGKTLDETLQGEVARRHETRAVWFIAFPCAAEVEIPPMLQVLHETYQPLEGEPPSASITPPKPST